MGFISKPLSPKYPTTNPSKPDMSSTKVHSLLNRIPIGYTRACINSVKLIYCSTSTEYWYSSLTYQ